MHGAKLCMEPNESCVGSNRGWLPMPEVQNARQQCLWRHMLAASPLASCSLNQRTKPERNRRLECPKKVTSKVAIVGH